MEATLTTLGTGDPQGTLHSLKYIEGPLAETDS